MFEGMHWFAVSKRDPRAVALFSRHYSARKNGATIRDWLAAGITAPGESLVLLTPAADALFVWVKQRYVRNGERGVNCAVFRNEGPYLSSELIREAEALAWAKWPGERLYTYVDPSQIKSANPGYCFKMAGWTLVRDERGKPKQTSRGLLILEKFPDKSEGGDA